jgi:hypothetical protein
MRSLGFLLLLAGWMISLSAVTLLNGKASVTAFVLAGLAVEALGLAFVSRSHSAMRESVE